MILKSIHLQNYRRYADQLVEFPNGLIGIVGKNGAGKSTLIEAIGWGLYGNSAARTDKDEIKRTTANPKHDCKVVLEMVLGEDSLRIERELRGIHSTGMARLFVNGGSSAHVSGMAEVSNYISKRTGMDHIAFFTSVFAKQKELNALSDLQPGKRKETIMRLLRIDTIEDVIAKIKLDTKSGRDKIEFIKPTMKNVDVLIEYSTKLMEEKNMKESEIETAKQQAQELKKSAIAEKKKFKDEEEKYRQHTKIDSIIQRLSGSRAGKEDSKKTAEGDLSGANRSREELKKIEPQLSEYNKVKKEKEALDKQRIQFTSKNDLEKQVKDTTTAIKENKSQIEKIKNQLISYKDVDKSIKHNQKNLKSLQKKKESLEASANRLQGKIKGLDSQKKKSEQEFSRIKGLGKKSECPTCKRPIGEHLAEITIHFHSEIARFTKQIKDISSKKSDVLSKTRDIVVKITAAKKLETDLSSKRITKTKLTESLRGVEKNLGIYNKQAKTLTIKLKKFAGLNYDESRHQKMKLEFSRLVKIRDQSLGFKRDVARIPSLELRISTLERSILDFDRQIKEKEKKLAEVGFDESKYESSKESWDSANMQHNQKVIEITEKNGELKQVTLNIEQNKQEIIEEEKKREIVQTEEARIASRSKLERIMVDFKLHLISRIRPMLSSRASELFREMTNGKYPGLELDEDYNIKIEDEGMSFGVGRFSGGEEDLANLCLRIAISQELSERAGGSRANFIALDEIFGSQDEERKSNILKALSELSNQFKQILVITHIEDVKESLPYVLNIKENTDDTVRIEPEGIPLTVGNS